MELTMDNKSLSASELRICAYAVSELGHTRLDQSLEARERNQSGFARDFMTESIVCQHLANKLDQMAHLHEPVEYKPCPICSDSGYSGVGQKCLCAY